MTDPKRLYEDFRDFGRGSNIILRIIKLNIFLLMNHKAVAWHMHIFFIFDRQAPFIPKQSSLLIWGGGSVL